ncbi:MAG: lamin tail domain-containing protein [Flavobacteriales bacterium]
MKSIFTFLSALTLSVFSSFQSNGQGCSDLIISEVLEGWSNNKAIEIYNPTAAAIDASEYGLVRFQNGSTTPGNITYLTEVSIAPYDVYVVVLDKRDPDGVDFEAPIWDELQLQADIFVNPSYNDGQEVMYFNGNDAIAIVKDGGQVLVDVFAKIGDSLNPDGWGGYLDADGEQAYVSQDHTLIRKSSFTEGYTTNPESFDILNEYDSLPANTFDQLGFHICECDLSSVEKFEFSKEIKVFPNPLANGFVTVTATERIEAILIFDTTGKLLLEEKVEALQSTYLDLTAFPKGTFFLKARLESGAEISQLLVK